MWNEFFRVQRDVDVTSVLVEVIKKASSAEEAVERVKSTLDSILEMEERELELIRRAICHEEMDMLQRSKRFNIMLLICNLLVSVFVLFVAFAAL